MTLLGLDFDNTIVCYDKLFHKIALERKLIEQSCPAKKPIIRKYIQENHSDEEFTLIQGEVYGNRIEEAEPAEGVIEALTRIKRDGIDMVIVSHKTRYPYKGPKHDLHKSALRWLTTHNFFSSNGLNWDINQVYFEETKYKKAKKIDELKCDHYIDDLEEILDMLPDSIGKIHYSTTSTKGKYKKMSNWGQLNSNLTLLAE